MLSQVKSCWSCSRLENRRIPNDLWPLFLTWSWRRRICINAVLWVWDFDDLWLILHMDDVGFTCRFGTFYGLYNPTTSRLVWSEVSSLNLFDEFFKDQKACCSSVSAVYHAHLEVTCMVPQLQMLRDTDTPLCRVWQKVDFSEWLEIRRPGSPSWLPTILRSHAAHSCVSSGRLVTSPCNPGAGITKPSGGHATPRLFLTWSHFDP